MDARKVERLWEIPGEKRFVVYTSAGRELAYPAGFRDRRLKVGAVIDDDDVAELTATVREYERTRSERREARRAKRAAARPRAGTITNLESKGRGRVWVYLDGAYAFSVTEGVAASNGLAAGRELAEADVTRLQTAHSVTRVAEAIDKLTSYRPRTVAEVRERLVSKRGMDPELVEQAIRQRMGAGIMSDDDFAAWASRLKGERKGKDFRMIVPDLRKAGVNDEAIDQAGAAFDRDAALETALAKLARRLDPADERSVRRFINAVVRRGFRYGDAKAYLDRLAVIDEELDEATLQE